MAKHAVPKQQIKPKPKRSEQHASKRKTVEHVVVEQGLRSFLDRPCLSDCAQRYVKAIHAPWSTVRACVPLPPCFPSQKLQCWYKGTMSTGTQGVGFVLVKPTKIAASDLQLGTYSDNLYAGAALDTNAATSGVNSFNSNSPYIASNFVTDETYYRLVAIGIRVRYVGSELNRGGSVVSLVEPDHANINGFGIGSLLGYKGVHQTATGRGWHECVWFPIDATEVAYRNDPTNDSTYCMAIMAKAASAATTVSYEFEVFGKLEVQGIKARGADVMRGDTIGGSAVIEHFAAHAPSGRVNSTSASIKSSLDTVDSLVKDASGIYQAIKSGASRAKGWWDAAVTEANNLIPEIVESGAAIAAR